MIWPDVDRVTCIRFEWSPGRNDERYTGNRSAFDVFVEYNGARGRSFLGIEVKYHEDLTGTPATDKGCKYPGIAAEHGVFRQESMAELTTLPLQQLWLDHLLALQMLAREDRGAGTFVLKGVVGEMEPIASLQSVLQRCKSCCGLAGPTPQQRRTGGMRPSLISTNVTSWGVGA